MSDDKADKSTVAAPQTGTPPAAPPAPGSGDPSLTRLMAAGEAPGVERARPDLEHEALRAAEQALAAGERALAAARAQVDGEGGPAAGAAARRRRELVLRVLLMVNVAAMVFVASLPVPSAPASSTSTAAPPPAEPAAPPSPPPPRFHEPWNRALEAAERGEFAAAVTILEQYLDESPRLSPSQQLSVLSTLAHYAARNDDYKKAQQYQRRAEALEQSHSLPEDLVAMAEAAAKNGDQETLRRVWARFLLQQRQIPTWLHRHVAEAYLQLGDSYRAEANQAAEQQRLRELEATEARLRAEAIERGGRPK